MAPAHTPQGTDWPTIAVVGSTGFLGRAVVARLARGPWRVRAIARSPGHVANGNVETMDLAAPAEELFAGCSAVVNCAGRAHVMKREAPDEAEDRFLAVNRDLALRWAEAARDAGARRFVQISSVAALCSNTPPGKPVDDRTPPAPEGAYGRSKLAGDEALAQLDGPGFKVIALRPPAIYGPGVRAWFAMLNKAARIGLPLPVGAIDNRRSFAFVGNVADAVAAGLESDLAGAYIVTDSEPVSTADLYRRLLRLHGHGDRVWRFPRGVIAGAARLALGGRSLSLIGDAAYDGSAFARATGWRPPVSMDEGLRITVMGTDAQA